MDKKKKKACVYKEGFHSIIGKPITAPHITTECPNWVQKTWACLKYADCFRWIISLFRWLQFTETAKNNKKGWTLEKTNFLHLADSDISLE